MRARVSLLFFLSGLTGLIYEVLWARILGLYLGHTALAQTIVLATFLGGMALGYALAGRRADSESKPLRAYGRLELAIAVAGMLSPAALRWAGDLYVALASGGAPPAAAAFLQLAASALTILLPAGLMGATLPYLVRWAASSRTKVERELAWLYFVNGAGAVVGALLAGFSLVPVLGLELSVLLAAALNVAVGAAAVFSSQRPPSERRAGRGIAERASGPSAPRFALAAAFASGVTTLAYELCWTRLLTLVLGGSTYAFTVMLASFISGLSLGGLLIGLGAFPSANSLLLFGLVQLTAAFSLALSLPFVDRLPYLFWKLSSILAPSGPSFGLYYGAAFAFCLAFTLPLTASLGMALPLAGRLGTSDSRVGRGVGSVFSWNALGNVLGAAGAGLLLLPLLGLRRLLEAALAVNLVLGAWALALERPWARERKWAGAAALSAAMAALLALAPAWDFAALTAGLFRPKARHDWADFAAFKSTFAGRTVLFNKDDRDMTVTVTRGPDGTRQLKVNGKTDASTGFDMWTQKLVAHIPLLLRPGAKRMFVVGLGSGVTIGTALLHPLDEIEVAEWSRGVVEAARFFQPLNLGALTDPRVRLTIADAKAYLRLSRKKYDIIVSEPSNPWIAGIGNIYTVEFFRTAGEHLAPGGLFAQWFHLYEMDDDTLKLVLRTFSTVFPNTTLWAPSPGDVVMIGSDRPFLPDLDAVERELNLPGVREDLAAMGITRPATALSMETETGTTVRWLAGRGRLNEDMYPLLEYQAPRALLADSRTDLVEKFDQRLWPDRRDSLYLAVLPLAKEGGIPAAEWPELEKFHRRFSGRFHEALIREWAAERPKDAAAAQRNETSR